MEDSNRRDKQKKELPQYVSRVMKAKGLSARDVAARSGQRITAAYVTGIKKGTAANPSVDKIIALAAGLGADRYEVFDMACEPQEAEAEQPRVNERLQSVELLDLMKRVVMNRWLMKIVENAVHLRAKDLEALLGAVQRFREATSTGRGKKKRR
ncbi:MAG: helix-turn-helix domain-containing protein [Acidobacteriota bacterium]